MHTIDTIHFIILMIVILTIFYFVFNPKHDTFANASNLKFSLTPMPIGSDPRLTMKNIQGVCNACVPMDPQKLENIVCPKSCPNKTECTEGNNYGNICYA